MFQVGLVRTHLRRSNENESGIRRNVLQARAAPSPFAQKMVPMSFAGDLKAGGEKSPVAINLSLKSVIVSTVGHVEDIESDLEDPFITEGIGGLASEKEHISDFSEIEAVEDDNSDIELRAIELSGTRKRKTRSKKKLQGCGSKSTILDWLKSETSSDGLPKGQVAKTRATRKPLVIGGSRAEAVASSWRPRPSFVEPVLCPLEASAHDVGLPPQVTWPFVSMGDIERVR
jgi:hypothetical protein